ncbi:hypothetical protein CCR97_22030 [Rhodoplanes elegans]|nr:hypothetical protein [Rhodoplanes elegans]
MITNRDDRRRRLRRRMFERLSVVMNRTRLPLVPAQAGTQERHGTAPLDPRLRGDERSVGPRQRKPLST